MYTQQYPTQIRVSHVPVYVNNREDLLRKFWQLKHKIGNVTSLILVKPDRKNFYKFFQHYVHSELFFTLYIHFKLPTIAKETHMVF